MPAPAQEAKQAVSFITYWINKLPGAAEPTIVNVGKDATDPAKKTLNNVIYQMGLWAPVVGGAISPFLVYEKAKDQSPEKRKLLRDADMWQQISNASTHVLCYIGLAVGFSLLAKKSNLRAIDSAKNKLFHDKLGNVHHDVKQLTGKPKVLLGEAGKLYMTILGNLGGFVGYAAIRPVLGTVLEKHSKKNSKSTPEPHIDRPHADSQPEIAAPAMESASSAIYPPAMPAPAGLSTFGAPFPNHSEPNAPNAAGAPGQGLNVTSNAPATPSSVPQLLPAFGRRAPLATLPNPAFSASPLVRPGA